MRPVRRGCSGGSVDEGNCLGRGPEVRNLLAIAAAEGLDAPLRAAFTGPVAAVCVGPVCAATARRNGVGCMVTPLRSRVGPMIRSLGENLEARIDVMQVDGMGVEVRGTTVETPLGRAELETREVQAALDPYAATSA